MYQLSTVYIRDSSFPLHLTVWMEWMS